MDLEGRNVPEAQRIEVRPGDSVYRARRRWRHVAAARVRQTHVRAAVGVRETVGMATFFESFDEAARPRWKRGQIGHGDAIPQALKRAENRVTYRQLK